MFLRVVLWPRLRFATSVASGSRGAFGAIQGIKHMTKQSSWFSRLENRAIVLVVAFMMAGIAVRPSTAEDWGSYAIIPASSPALVLEAVGSGTADGTVVSIGKPAGTANQKWVITPKGNDLYAVKPAHSSDLVLAAAKGGTEVGTAIVLETESGQPWQQWNLKKNEDGTYCLLPQARFRKGPRSFWRQAEARGPDRPVDECSGRSAPALDHQAAGRHDHGGCGRSRRDAAQRVCAARSRAGRRS